jgi:hypothetical protein
MNVETLRELNILQNEDGIWYKHVCTAFTFDNVNSRACCGCRADKVIFNKRKRALRIKKVLSALTNQPYRILDWTVTAEDANGYISEERALVENKQAQCICTHNIWERCVITHIPTGIKVVVGNKCAKNLTHDLDQLIDKGGCELCGKALTDRRKKYQREFYCSKHCYDADGQCKIPFGKYKGERENILYDDPSYCRWLTRKDHNIRIKYPQIVKFAEHVLDNPKEVCS